MTLDLLADLRARGFRGTLRAECPLGPFTTWRIGGPAELLGGPADRDDLLVAVAWARERGVRWRVLGNGSNLLVREAGVRGLVLRLRRALDGIRLASPAIDAGAGAMLPAVANLAAARGLAGLEFGAGIPGTVGGAVRMNAGWHEHEIGRVVAEVEVLDPDGSIAIRAGRECGFGYRDSVFRRGAQVVLGARFVLRADDPAAVRARMEAYAESRRTSQPTELSSCGSVFLKPPGDFAGRLIEQAGLKGLRVGDVQISPKHANFFVNLGGATAADVLALVERAEQEVERRFGVRLEREFELW